MATPMLLYTTIAQDLACTMILDGWQRGKRCLIGLVSDLVYWFVYMAIETFLLTASIPIMKLRNEQKKSEREK